MATPRLAGGRRFTVSLSKESVPLVISSSPQMRRKSVDLPQPEGPTKTMNSPERMSMSMPLMTSKAPKDLRRSRS